MKNLTNTYGESENRMAPSEIARFMIGRTIRVAEVRNRARLRSAARVSGCISSAMLLPADCWEQARLRGGMLILNAPV